MKPGPAGSEAESDDDSANGERDAIVAWGSAAAGQRLDTLVRTGDYDYGLPLDGLPVDPYFDEGGESE
jgi:hypothetical protein